MTTLADQGGYAEEPTWRADSTRIVFSGQLPGSFRAGVLLTVSVAGNAEPVELGAAHDHRAPPARRAGCLTRHRVNGAVS